MIKSLSIILPVFNEEKRLKQSLLKVKNFFYYKKIKKKEFIFVDDGSTDKTKKIIKEFIDKNKTNNKIKLISLLQNHGKGAALKKGVLSAKNSWILTSDIDFSVSMKQLDTWIKKKYIYEIKKKIVYFASRANPKSTVKSKISRRVIGYFLSKIIFYFLGIKIKDTQCGFKLYSKNIAKKIYKNVTSKGFEHDIEIVLLLKKKAIKIIELPVKWTHYSGSKVNVILDSMRVLKNIFILKKKYH